MDRKTLTLFVLLLGVWMVPLNAQHVDKHITKTVNAWHIHGVSRTLSTSSEVLPVALPLGMLAYGALKSDREMIKDAVYVGSSVVEAVALSVAIKQFSDRRRPYMKYPEDIHPYEIGRAHV